MAGLLGPFFVGAAVQFAEPSAASYFPFVAAMLAPVWIWSWGGVLVAAWFLKSSGAPEQSTLERASDWAKAAFLDVWFLAPSLFVFAWLFSWGEQ